MEHICNFRPRYTKNVVLNVSADILTLAAVGLVGAEEVSSF